MPIRVTKIDYPDSVMCRDCKSGIALCGYSGEAICLLNKEPPNCKHFRSKLLQIKEENKLYEVNDVLNKIEELILTFRKGE